MMCSGRPSDQRGKRGTCLLASVGIRPPPAFNPCPPPNSSTRKPGCMEDPCEWSGPRGSPRRGGDLTSAWTETTVSGRRGQASARLWLQNRGAARTATSPSVCSPHPREARHGRMQLTGEETSGVGGAGLSLSRSRRASPINGIDMVLGDWHGFCICHGVVIRCAGRFPHTRSAS